MVEVVNGASKSDGPVYGTLPVELLFDKTSTDQSRSGQSLQPHWPELSDSWVDMQQWPPVACTCIVHVQTLSLPCGVSTVDAWLLGNYLFSLALER